MRILPLFIVLSALAGCGNDDGKGGSGGAASGGSGPTAGAESEGGSTPSGGTAPSGGAEPTAGSTPSGGMDPHGGSAPNGGSSTGGSVQGGSGAGAGGALVNPTITELSPPSLPVGSATFELVLRGTNFRSDHMVGFDHNVFSTTFVSAEELHAEIPSPALGVRARTVDVQVARIADPALRSNVFPFEITAAP